MNALWFVLFSASAVCCINIHLVKDFLKFKQSKSVVLFLCNPFESHTIFTILNDDRMFVKIADMKNESLHWPKPNAYARTSFVFEYSCESYLEKLEKNQHLKNGYRQTGKLATPRHDIEMMDYTKVYLRFQRNSLSTVFYIQNICQFSDQWIFNLTYSWLFTADDKNSSTQLINSFSHLNGLQMNSDVTIALPKEDPEEGFELLGVYSPGRHLCKDIYRYKYGEWNLKNGVVIVPGFSTYKERADFEGLRLRGVTVIDRDNVTSEDVDRILSSTGREKGVVLLIKYHYAILTILRDYHNFTIHYRITRGWAGRLKSGFRLGLLGIVQRNEADVATTGILHRRNRHAENDFIHFSWEFTTGFLYRMTPQLRDSSGSGSFTTPFDGMVWLASAVTLTTVLLVLKFVSLIIAKMKRFEPSHPFMSYIVDVIATIAQQGSSNEVSGRVSIRIIIFSLLFLTLLLYNYYTSSVVGGLLSSPGKGPYSLQEITDSPLTLSFHDIGYNKVLFAESKNPVIREMYRKKAKPSREGKNTIPVYADVMTAVPYLKQGGYAFHCELTEAFEEIANQFDAYEICELRTGASLFTDLKLLGMILPKRSMYSEMFKTTLMRAQEIGLIKRNLKRYRAEKPTCQAGSRIHPVEFSSVRTAFAILGVGFAASLVLFCIERLWFNSVLKRESMNFIE